MSTSGPTTEASLRVERWARVRLVGDPSDSDEAWLLLHGYGMTARGIAHWFRTAAQPGRLLVAPEALSRFYRGAHGLRTIGASWMTSEDRLHEIADQADYLDQVAERWLVGRGRVEVHGFSQGVHTGCRWSIRAPVKIHRLVCWGSALPSDLPDGALARLVMSGCELVLATGRDDMVVPTDHVVADGERLRAEGVPVTLHSFSGGHEVNAELLAQLTS